MYEARVTFKPKGVNQGTTTLKFKVGGRDMKEAVNEAREIGSQQLGVPRSVLNVVIS